jgi:superfamily II DNA helicase RecQ
MGFNDDILNIEIPSFEAIRQLALRDLFKINQSVRDELYEQLKRGTALLETHEQLCAYLNSFGPRHSATLQDSISRLPNSLFNEPFEIVDWGCGQAMGTINVLDFLSDKGRLDNIKKITLIEPAKAALERGLLHVKSYKLKDIQLVSIDRFFEEIEPQEIQTEQSLPVLHIFSNILDVEQIDLKYLSQLVDSSVVSENYLLCVGPLNPTNQRIDSFFSYFDDDLIQNLYSYQSKTFGPRQSWTYKARVYKLSPIDQGHLIPIKYYPPVQFRAAYELDLVRDHRKKSKIIFPKILSAFEVVAPFDLGASVYDDVEPILAVLHNIIVRGLPTKASVFIEKSFQKAFNKTEPKLVLGEIKYDSINDHDFNNITELFSDLISSDFSFQNYSIEHLQWVLSPIAISRFQKVIIEAIITGHLDWTKTDWKILVQEDDIPFAAIAIEDFKQLFNALTSLSNEYQKYTLPKIELVIQSNIEFLDSPLHLDYKVYKEFPSNIKQQKYDLVVTQSLVKSINDAIDSFSNYIVFNNCYFNIRNATVIRSERVIYTSSLIKYQGLVIKSEQGNYHEIEESKTHLTYFLQLFFRKKAFRPGQLPILDRALKNQPVIGLLPTGGGKSLTYQIAALLQPGISMIIDPLKSLMKDQFDGLVNSGIDCCAYINSSLTTKEREDNEEDLESSRLLFIFLSPERLSIAHFRERLRNMHEYNVYFSYGIIDEVHCVSEWGHDFRFSYLHLGRNLYNYVRAKDGIISLFGLTATASFDVLADVERELSSNGTFELDTDVIVRYENTNRLELQYKIEKVPVAFEVDAFYDRYKKMPAHLPKALNITNHWPQYDSKGNYLVEYLSNVAKYINDLQVKQNIKKIREAYIERQNNEEGIDIDLNVDMPENLFVEKSVYNEAGIVFCPHVDNTGLSVRINANRIKNQLIPVVGSFTGADDDKTSMKNLELFRENKLPLMVATKAFGMGIDKPNVRFTVNINYSSSLEAFVQEAGRAGRDRKIALSTIFISDYKLAKIDRSFNFPHALLPIFKNKWFHQQDLNKILTELKIDVPKNKILTANPENDVVRLYCKQDNRMFQFGQCSSECSSFGGCKLRTVSSETKGWKAEIELVNDLRTQGISLSKKQFQYLNADYQSVMYFFNSAFKGDAIEKRYMTKLLNTLGVEIASDEFQEGTISNGFLMKLLETKENESIVVYVNYIPDKEIPDDKKDDPEINGETDLEKAIYRMTCIGLLEDFTKDFGNKKFRIIARRKTEGDYYNGLREFLLRYYTAERADNELKKVLNNNDIDQDQPALIQEIYRCLAYLTEFVYDKISEKRKRAIDDMRNFCIDGLSENESWLHLNEKLKDFIFYYFNSKYAKTDYATDFGEPYSLVIDTDEGKFSNAWIVEKYLKVASDENVIGISTPLDNIKHLFGAIRLISRSLTDRNPSLEILEAFCLVYLGFKKNDNLRNQFYMRLTDGMTEMHQRFDSKADFWEFFESFKEILKPFLKKEKMINILDETAFLIHAEAMKKLTKNYLNNDQ